VLFGRREPEFRDAADRPADAPEAYIDNNASQNEAVSLAVDAEDGALIHGPPGTGKTYTIARTIRALVEEGNRVVALGVHQPGGRQRLGGPARSGL